MQLLIQRLIARSFHCSWFSFVQFYILFYSTSQKFGHTFSFNGFSLFLFLSTMQINIEDIKTMKEHIWNYVVNKKL